MPTSAPSTELDESLLDAAFKCNAVLVQTLIRAGANINFINEFSDSGIMIAAVNGYDKVVKILIGAGANIDWTNNNGESALHYAAHNGHAEVVKTLIDAGAGVDLFNKKGASALHYAAHNGHAEVVNSLIGAGAYIDCAPTEGSYKGRTALEYIALSMFINEDKKKERLVFLLDIGANVRPEFFNNNDIFPNIRAFVKEYIKPENATKREENLLKNTNLQDAFKESILAGKPITFRDNVVDKVLLKALRSITQKDLEETGKENLDKLKKSGIYPLLKIMNNLSEDEFSLAAKNLKDFKIISDKAPFFRSSDKLSGNMDSGDIMSKILMHSLMPNSLDEALTLKIIDQIKILTAPATRSDPSLNSDGASASLLDSQQISAQARATGPSAPFSESPPINPVVKADFVFVSPNAPPSNPQQISAQASTIGPSPHVAESTQRAEPVVTAQLVLVPAPNEDPSKSPRGARPGSVRALIAQIEGRLKETESNSK
jgi:hypothetical protein